MTTASRRKFNREFKLKAVELSYVKRNIKVLADKAEEEDVGDEIVLLLSN